MKKIQARRGWRLWSSVVVKVDYGVHEVKSMREWGIRDVRGAKKHNMRSLEGHGC
jgi:hypothetical protein